MRQAGAAAPPVFNRVFAATWGPSGRAWRRAPHDTPGEYARIALRRPRAPVYCSPASGAGTPRGTLREEARRTPAWCRKDPPAGSPRRPVLGPRSRYLSTAHHPSQPSTRDHDRRMDAKQVWRAALGELQVSLSPANYETWLRETRLVDVDDQRFRIAVPNGFAKDWLETPLPVPDLPDARAAWSATASRSSSWSRANGAADADGRRRQAGGRPAAAAGARRAHPGRRPRGRRRRDLPQPALHLLELHRRARPTGSPTRHRCRSPSAPATPTTRCSSTAAWASARPT